GPVQGSVSSLAAGRLLVSAPAARAHHWHVGDTVTIGFGSYGVSRLRIGGIFTNVGPLTDYLVSIATFTPDTGRPTDTVDLVLAPASPPRPLPRPPPRRAARWPASWPATPGRSCSTRPATRRAAAPCWATCSAWSPRCSRWRS